MVIKLKLVVILGFVAFLNLEAQHLNNIIVWGSGGYSSLLHADKDISSPGGLGGGVGVGYELHYKKFLFHTGLEFTYLNPTLRMSDFIHNQEGLMDTEGELYTGHFYFKENTDKYKLGNFNLPLMFGLRSGKVYFLAGTKLGLNLFGNSTVESQVTATGTYDRFIEDFENMPNHNFGTTNEKHDYSVKLNFNCTASLEAGTYLGNNKNADKTQYRLAVFCDYGLLNVNNNPEENLILYSNEVNFYQPYLNNYLKSSDRRVNPLYVGLKFTVIFGVESKKDCMCDFYSHTNKKKK